MCEEHLTSQNVLHYPTALKMELIGQFIVQVTSVARQNMTSKRENVCLLGCTDAVAHSDWIATQSSMFWCVAVVTVCVCVYFVVLQLDVTSKNLNTL